MSDSIQIVAGNGIKIEELNKELVVSSSGGFNGNYNELYNKP